MTLLLTPEQVTLHQLERLYRDALPFTLDVGAWKAIAGGAARLAAGIERGVPIYGVNTGFGKLASVRIADDNLEELQKNLVRSHCAGFGAPLPAAMVRLMIALKCISLGRGASGVRPVVVERLQQLVASNVIPVIPEKGSVGASGDLAPLAHMAATLIGEGTRSTVASACRRRRHCSAPDWSRWCCRPKKGWRSSMAHRPQRPWRSPAWFNTWRLAVASLTTTALSIDAAMGSSAPFHEGIHHLRGHPGQIESAERLRELLQGSAIRNSHFEGDERVQDPYCLRCAPQVIGACLDQLRHVGRTLCIEANAATDNPLVLEDGQIVSGGNFHAEPVAFAADLTAIAISEIGCLSQRRSALLVDPALSFGLPAFLAARPGLQSGLMIAEVTSAALMSENRSLANPRSIDSTPTSANQEDHVSMSCHAARRLVEMNTNLAGILAVEAMAATQGIELRSPLTTSAQLQHMTAAVRTVCPPMKEDRMVSGEIEALSHMILEEAGLSNAGNAIPALERVTEPTTGHVARSDS